jgi:hypothetical protein
MSAPMNQPPYSNQGEEPPDTPEDPTWTRTGTYVTPEFHDLSASGIAPTPGTALPTTSQLGENNYAPGRATGGDVDQHRYTDDFHGPSYGELGPRPFPN